MNVFIILSILVIALGVVVLMASPSTLFRLNWGEKILKDKILMFLFYGIIVYNKYYFLDLWLNNSYNLFALSITILMLF